MKIEEKAKAYDGNYKAYTELINRLEDVKNAIKKQNYRIAMDILCKPYPEFQVTTPSKLKESDDERIRKAIKKALQVRCYGSRIISDEPVTLEEAIAWFEKQGENNMGISEATKQELEDNLHKSLEKETTESWNEILDKQGEQKETLCDKCKKAQPSHSCQDITALGRCALEKQDEQKPAPKYKIGDTIYFNSFGKVQSIIVANIIDNGDNNPMYEDTDGSSVFESDIIEQKPADKVEPKFKVGDWLVNIEHGNVIRVLEVLKDNYRLDFGGYTIGTLCTELVDNDYRLWDITKDAKYGDVLFQDLMGGKTFIYNGVNPNMAILYSFIISNDGEDVLPYNIGKPNTGIGNIEENKNIIHPATKEQRDQLEKAMADAGYTFDFEKK